MLTMKDIESLRGSAFVERYNIFAELAGEKPVSFKNFKSRDVAIRRVANMAVKAHMLPACHAVGRRPNSRRWVLQRPPGDFFKPVSRKSSARADAERLLLVGGTLADVVAIVREHDRKDGVERSICAERRAARLVLTLNNKNGYGIAETADPETGKIRLKLIVPELRKAR